MNDLEKKDDDFIWDVIGIVGKVFFFVLLLLIAALDNEDIYVEDNNPYNRFK